MWGSWLRQLMPNLAKTLPTAAAPDGVMRDERPLQQMEVSVAKPLGGDDLHVLMCDRRCQPAERAAPLQQDRAGAALPVIAALRGPGVHGQAVLRTVHPERDLDTHDLP